MRVFDDSGNAAAVKVGYRDGFTVLPFTMPPRGSTTLVLSGDARATTGSARVTSTIPVRAALRFGSETLGISGVGQSTALASMVAPAVRNATTGINTGIAISNPQSRSVVAKLVLRAADGIAVPGGETTIPLTPNGHIAAFIDQLFPNAVTSDFQGAIVIRSDTAGANVSAVAIQLGDSAGEFTAFPVLSEAPASSSSRLLFPQFATGGGVSSTLYLVSTSEGPDTATIRFTNDEGNAMRDEQQLTLSARGVKVFFGADQGGLMAGWATVTAGGQIGGSVLFNISGLGIAGVGSAEASSGFITPVSRSTSSRFNTGLALVAPDGPAGLTLALYDPGGRPVPNGQATLDLPANGHTARFIDELFQAADIREFEGTLVVIASSGTVAGTALQLGSLPGEFTTLPVTPLRP